MSSEFQADGSEPDAEALASLAAYEDSHTDEEIESIAEDCFVEEAIEEWKIERHRADVRHHRLTGAWRFQGVRPIIRTRGVRARPREHRARRTARTGSTRGDPDPEPEPDVDLQLRRAA